MVKKRSIGGGGMSVFGRKPDGVFITGKIQKDAAKRLEEVKREVARDYRSQCGRDPARAISTAEAIEYLLYGRVLATAKFV